MTSYLDQSADCHISLAYCPSADVQVAAPGGGETEKKLPAAPSASAPSEASPAAPKGKKSTDTVIIKTTEDAGNGEEATFEALGVCEDSIHTNQCPIAMQFRTA